ncbi:MAG: response regulator [Alicyclobacillus sp.]|nr:response regulator [Alicyclobacillus sp.]
MIRALLVDDSPEILEVLRMMCQATGEIEVVATARNNQEAMAALEHIDIDLISIDILMGSFNGLDLCRSVRRRSPDVFITICSAESSEDNRRLAASCGAQHFLDKPVRMEALNELIGAYRVWNGAGVPMDSLAVAGLGDLG